MQVRLGLFLLLALSGCATNYDERWVDDRGQNRPQTAWRLDRNACPEVLDDAAPASEADATLLACMKKHGWSRILIPRKVSLF
jgi:hypothetical protein